MSGVYDRMGIAKEIMLCTETYVIAFHLNMGHIYIGFCGLV